LIEKRDNSTHRNESLTSEYENEKSIFHKPGSAETFREKCDQDIRNERNGHDPGIAEKLGAQIEIVVECTDRTGGNCEHDNRNGVPNPREIIDPAGSGTIHVELFRKGNAYDGDHRANDKDKSSASPSEVIPEEELMFSEPVAPSWQQFRFFSTFAQTASYFKLHLTQLNMSPQTWLTFASEQFPAIAAVQESFASAFWQQHTKRTHSIHTISSRLPSISW